jgi:hypothetical protein
MGKEGRKREEKERKKTNFLDKKLVWKEASQSQNARTPEGPSQKRQVPVDSSARGLLGPRARQRARFFPTTNWFFQLVFYLKTWFFHAFIVDNQYYNK